MEFASIFHRFGSKVTILEMLPRTVPVEDEEVSKELERSFKKSGIRIETGARAENIRKGGAGVQVTVTLANGKTEEMEAEKLLVAVGRKPNTENAGLENTKIELDRGFVKVNQFQQTGEPGVYAIGDIVAGTPQLAHVATHGRHGGRGSHGWQTREAHQPEPNPRRHIHRARDRQCRPYRGSGKAQGFKVKVGKFPFLANSKATILGMHEGFVKVVIDEKWGEILGVHIIGPQAYELISEAVTAMESEATVETMMNTIHAHPTIYEAVGEAFNAVYGLAINF